MRDLEVVDVEGRIRIIRGQRVMLDRDLAELYGVESRAINQALRRNRERFPDGFAFQLSSEERASVIRESPRLITLKFAHNPPIAFTDYGVAMLSSVLRSRRAVHINIRIIQAFVRLRRLAAQDGELRIAVAALQAKLGEHDESIQKLFDALGEMGDGGLRPIRGFLPKE